jgi:hypothetical protein
MKRLILSIFVTVFCIIALCGNGWAVTSTFTDTGDHLWGTAGNWDNGIPDATVDAVISAGTTALNLGSTARACKTFTATGTSGLTITGSAAFSVSGNFTIDSNVTWNTTGNLYMVAAGTFTTGNATITCAIWGDNGQAGAKTLTVGSSTINCTNVSWGTVEPTVTANTATINVTTPASEVTWLYFGSGKTWAGTTTINVNQTGSIHLATAGTFGNLTINMPPYDAGKAAPYAFLFGNITITSTFTLVGSDYAYRPKIAGYAGWSEAGTVTITAGAVAISKAIDFQGITGAGAASWDLSAIPSGNMGGNSGITFRTPATYYLIVGDNLYQDYNNCYSATDDGAARTAGGTSVFPLPQDTLIIDDNSFGAAGNKFYFHYGMRSGNIDASRLTKSTTLALPRNLYGDLIYTGSGIVLATGDYPMTRADARLKNESSDTLDIKIRSSINQSNMTIKSYGGTVRLMGNLTTEGTITLTLGTLDLHHYTITGTFVNTAGTVINTPRGGFFF